MPNWCSNTLAIHGSTEAVNKFIEQACYSLSNNQPKENTHVRRLSHSR